MKKFSIMDPAMPKKGAGHYRIVVVVREHLGRGSKRPGTQGSCQAEHPRDPLLPLCKE